MSDSKYKRNIYKGRKIGHVVFLVFRSVLMNLNQAGAFNFSRIELQTPTREELIEKHPTEFLKSKHRACITRCWMYSNVRSVCEYMVR